MESNNTRPFSSECAYFSRDIINTAVACLFFLLFPVAFLLNGLAAWVSLHLRSTSTFIVYLKSLVAADLLMTLTLPLMAASTLPGASLWLKAFSCRYNDVIFYSCLYTSIALMGLISLDRFFKIVRPCGLLLGQTVVCSLVMSSSVWVVLFGTTVIPTMVLTDQQPVNITGDLCMSLKSKVGLKLHKYVVLSMEILFWLVTMVIVFCYVCITLKVLKSFRNSGSNNSQGKKKTKLRVFLILLVYFVCFVPLHVMRVPFTLYEVFDIHVCDQVWVTVVHKLALWLSTTNACLDPVLYIYLCREYRDKLLEMMKARGIRVALQSSENEDVSV
ncbi:P2Y purinoceptor 13-like [Centropristis striata]|uniref:P2Y purinoceptor 13-like n=1 Tax=Centropristis striata TaxID=184440 RepID=UPI0027E1F261|nr:P2Y purinoceptor 13-like [Centropristis striata]